MVSEMETILIGFFGGIIGGLSKDMVSYLYQKNDKKKEGKKRYRTEYKENIKAMLTEIIETWNKELSQDPLKLIKIEREFGDYSSQLTSIIARAPDDFPEDVKKEIRALTSDFERLPTDVFIHYDDEYGDIEFVYRKCYKIREKAEAIIEKINKNYL